MNNILYMAYFSNFFMILINKTDNQTLEIKSTAAVQMRRIVTDR